MKLKPEMNLFLYFIIFQEFEKRNTTAKQKRRKDFEKRAALAKRQT